MTDIDLVKRKPDGGLAEWIEILEAGDNQSDAVLLCLLLELRRFRQDKPALIEQLEAAQRQRDELLHKDYLTWHAAACKFGERAEAAEAELKRRDEQDPVAWAHRLVNKQSGVVHPWVYGSSEKETSEGDIFCVEVMPLYAAATDAVHENALLPDHKFRECVNGLLEEAIAYAGTQQLRARLSSRLSNFVKPQRAAGVKWVEGGVTNTPCYDLPQ